VYDALGNPLAVEVREFFDQMMVLEQNWPCRARSPGVLVVGDCGSTLGGQLLPRLNKFLRLIGVNA